MEPLEPPPPLCFVLMPFGRKTDAAGRVTDFDSVFRTIIAPAVQDAGLEPIRADEEKIGGTIHKPMFERLMLCHYAVADITGANPNVFYELGIRHALRPASTAIVFLEGTVIPFDVALARGIAYRTNAAGEPVETESVKAAITGHLRAARQNPHPDSPLFQLVDVMVLGARIPVLSFQSCGLPALLAGACGGLAAWVVTIGLRPIAKE